MTTYSWLLLIEELEAINTSATKVSINHKNRFKRVYYSYSNCLVYDWKKILKKTASYNNKEQDNISNSMAYTQQLL